MSQSAVSAQDALADFLAKCDPASPADQGAYVDRPGPFAPWIGDLLRRVSAAKILVVGQAGVGKTTELARLESSLETDFTLLRPPIDKVLDLNMIGWHDLIVFSALWYWNKRSFPQPTAPGIYPSVTALERELLKGLVDESAPKSTGTQLFRNQPAAAHKRIELGRAQFWDLAVQSLSTASQVAKRSIVLVWDGLEKLPPASTARLFQEERRYVADLPLRTVVTAPLGLSFSPLFGEVEADFVAVSRLRAVSHRPGEPGFEFLKELAKRRGALRVMEEDLLDQTISWSGGLPRQLLQLLAAAATQALTDGLSRVERESFHRGRRKISERWQYQLGPIDYDALAKDDTNRSAEERSRLLSLGALLEYDKPDGGLGLGVNPLVGALIKERQASTGAGSR